MKIRSMFVATAAVLLSAASLSAQALHTWVSATGNDSTGTGTTAKPYATFQIAANNTAAGGIISVLGPGDYGPLTISQSLTIDGTGGGIITFTGSEGIYISAPVTATVVLRNLVINGVGEGDDAIYASTFLNLTIDGCRIEGFTDIGIGEGSSSAQNIVIRNTVITGGELGIRVFQGVGPDQLQVQNTTISGAHSGGNGVGIFIRSGILEVTNSVITQNDIGVENDTNSTISVESSMLTFNTVEAVCVYSGSKVRLENNDIFDNVTGVANCGGTVKTNGNNRDSGNTNGNPIPAADVSPTVLF